MAFITTLLLSTICLSQCTLKDLFPVDFGISKFKLSTIMASSKNMQEDNEANKYERAEWKKYDYLNGDSVHYTGVNYKFVNNPCIYSTEKSVFFRFVDDKLYSMVIFLDFSSTDFEKCKRNYDDLILIFKNTFTYYDPYISQDLIANEQDGEGYWFYNKKDTVKINYLSIEYSIVYEFNKQNIRLFRIKIFYIDLEGTRLTNEGY